MIRQGSCEKKKNTYLLEGFGERAQGAGVRRFSSRPHGQKTKAKSQHPKRPTPAQLALLLRHDCCSDVEYSALYCPIRPQPAKKKPSLPIHHQPTSPCNPHVQHCEHCATLILKSCTPSLCLVAIWPRPSHTCPIPSSSRKLATLVTFSVAPRLALVFTQMRSCQKYIRNECCEILFGSIAAKIGAAFGYMQASLVLLFVGPTANQKQRRNSELLSILADY